MPEFELGQQHGGSDELAKHPEELVGTALQLVAVGGDGVGEVLAAEPVHGSTRWTFRVPDPLARFIAPKGSVAIDGVSLTVNEVRGPEFSVNIIPRTSAVTSFGFLKPGDAVNIEIDTVARYVARLSEYR